MFASRSDETTMLFLVRWTARVTSVFSIGFILLFLFSSGPGFAAITWEKAGVLLLFPIGLLSGLVLSWEEELKGGALTVASVSTLWLISAIDGSMSGSWTFLMLGFPGILFIIYAALSGRRTAGPRAASRPPTECR